MTLKCEPILPNFGAVCSGLDLTKDLSPDEVKQITDAMDKYGNKVAKDLIGAIKVIAPQMAQTVTDRALQAHGGMGVSDDTPIAGFFTLNRFLRIADGPDEVHMSQLGKMKIQEYIQKDPHWTSRG